MDEDKDKKDEEKETKKDVNIQTEKDPIEELAGLVEELATATQEDREARDKKLAEMQADIDAYKESAKRGFVFPKIDDNMTVEEGDELFKGFDMARQGKRLMDKIHHPGHVIDSEEKRQEIAKWFVLFLKANLPHIAKYAHPENMARYMDYMNEHYPQKTAIGDSGNTFPIPDIVEEEIIAFQREKSVALQYARIYDMTSDTTSIPTETASATVAWSNTSSESEPTITEVELSAQELSCYSVIKNATLADARSDLVSWLTETLGETAAQELDNQTWNGTGSPVSGILTARCGYSVNMGTGSSAFSHLAGANGGDYLSEMIGKLDGLKKEGAMFHMNGSILHYVRILKDDNGNPVFYPGGAFGSPTPPTIYGYPYKEVVKMPSTSGSGVAFVSFGNLRYWGIGRRLDTTALQVDPYGLWTTNRTRFKIYQRWGLNFLLTTGFVRLLTA